MPNRLSYTVILLVSIALLSSLMGFANPETLAQGAGNDETNDLISGCTGNSVNQNLLESGGFVDIAKASASVEGSNLILRLETKKPIPSQASNLVSYSFLLDLDGDKETGFVGDSSPLGVFPQLGIDLWVNYSLYHKEEEDLGLLGSPNISNLNSTPTLTSYEIKSNRSVLEVTVPVDRVEMKLKYAYMKLDPPWKVKPNKMNWVAFTNWAPLSLENPVSDFFPGTYYSKNGRGCLTNPLVKIVKEKEEEKGKKVPPPPPPPPEPPS